MTALEAIKARISIRTYEERPVEQEKIGVLEECLLKMNKGPFGNAVRLMLVDVSGQDKDELKKYGSYGNIKGSRLFIAGAVKSGNGNMEDFGYCMEQAILQATELGLGTVWLGGGLNRSTFAQKVGAAEDEVIPAVTPVGYPSDKHTFTDNIIRFLSKARNRNQFGKIFFDVNMETPLTENACGSFAAALEAVRIAPSASNKQPWRVIRDDNGAFHFYLKEDVVYNNAFKGIKIQNLDMGIAMNHFELAVGELGLAGGWKFAKPSLEAGKLIYIASWVTQKG